MGSPATSAGLLRSPRFAENVPTDPRFGRSGTVAALGAVNVPRRLRPSSVGTFFGP
jgi:hypothetical protein